MPAIGDVKKLIVEYDFFGEPAQNGFHFRNISGASSEAALINAFQAAAETELLACLSNEVNISNYRVVDMIPGTGLSVQEPQVPVKAGTVAQPSDAPHLAAVISWYGTERGRGNRGRSYMGGIPHTFTDNGRLSAAGLVAYNAFAAALEAAFLEGSGTDADWVLVLWRGHLAGGTVPPFAPAAAAMPVSAHVVRSILRAQRRREIGVRISRRRTP